MDQILSGFLEQQDPVEYGEESVQPDAQPDHRVWIAKEIVDHRGDQAGYRQHESAVRNGLDPDRVCLGIASQPQEHREGNERRTPIARENGCQVIHLHIMTKHAQSHVGNEEPDQAEDQQHNAREYEHCLVSHAKPSFRSQGRPMNRQVDDRSSTPARLGFLSNGFSTANRESIVNLQR